MNRRAELWLGLSLLPAALPALASDGRIEINQAKALAGGVTPGDAPGFPAQITQPGSYVLTSDLFVTVAPSPENTTAIQVDVGSVTVDLNGFTIQGTTTCTGQGSTLSCAPVGTGTGILVLGPNSRIRNGRIAGIGGNCISIAPHLGVVEDLDLYSCGGTGLHLRGDVRRTRVQANNGQGILTREGVVESCTAQWNRFEGIHAQAGAVIRGNVVRENGAIGILAVDSQVTDNLLQANESFELNLFTTGWGGNTLLSCGASPCQAGGGNIQTAVNNCDASPCP